MVAGSALLPLPGLGKFSSAFYFSWHGASFGLQCSLIPFVLFGGAGLCLSSMCSLHCADRFYWHVLRPSCSAAGDPGREQGREPVGGSGKQGGKVPTSSARGGVLQFKPQRLQTRTSLTKMSQSSPPEGLFMLGSGTLFLPKDGIMQGR